MRGVFVAGTDTGVGKSVLAASICAALAAQGQRVAAFKPVVTGLDEAPAPSPAGEPWPPDHELLAAAAGGGQAPEEVAPYRFGPPLSPDLAAALAGTAIEPAALVSAARSAAADTHALICEGVGGLMVPLTPGYLVRDLAVDLGLPLVIAARTGLGTINHTLLTIEAARSAGLEVGGVVMTPWPDDPERIQASNRESIERLGAVSVSGLPQTDRASLASAGATLPMAEWLGGDDRAWPGADAGREA